MIVSRSDASQTPRRTSDPFLRDLLLTVVKMTPTEWLKEPEFSNILIMDPDGWDRGNFDVSWAEPLTKREFESRMAESTCQITRRLPDPPKIDDSDIRVELEQGQDRLDPVNAAEEIRWSKSEDADHVKKLLQKAMKFKKGMLDRNLRAAKAKCPFCEKGRWHGTLNGKNHLHFKCDGCEIGLVE